MATKPKSTKEYLAALAPDRRAALEQLRDAIKAAAPKAEEGFGYGIPALKIDGKTLYWYAAWTSHYSLYPLTPAVKKAHAKEIAGYATSKGTVRFPDDEPLPLALVKKMVKTRLAEMEKEG